MAYHDWSDNEFPWEKLNDAMNIIEKTCYRYGRFGGQIKEKFGTIRFYVRFFDGTLHSLLYPGYWRIRYPWFYHNIDVPIIYRLTTTLKIAAAIIWWQKKVYGWAHGRALKKYPTLAEEILCDADYPELIKGGIEMHHKMWSEHTK